MLTIVNKFINLVKILNKITSITIHNEDVYIKFKGDLFLESNNLFLYSKDGVLITKHKVTHFNPIINKNDLNLNDSKLLYEETKKINNNQNELNKIMLNNLSLDKIE